MEDPKVAEDPKAMEDPKVAEDPKAMEDPKVAEDPKNPQEPMKVSHPRVLWRNSAIVFLISFLLLSMADIIYYMIQNKKFDVEKAALNLGSTSSDAQLVLDTRLALTSYLHSYAIHEGHCSMFYSEGNDAPSKFVGDIYADVHKPSIATKSALAHVEAVFDLQNTDYAQLRRFLWDSQFGGAKGALFHVDCSASVTITLYRLIPLSFKQLSFELSHLSDNVDVSDTHQEHNQQNPLALVQAIGRAFSQFSEFTSGSQVEVLSTTSSGLSIGLKQLLPLVDPQTSFVTIGSFTVQVPRMAYTLESVDADVTTTLVLSSSETEVELVDTPQPELNTVVSVNCASTQGNNKCSLFNGLNIGEFVDQLRAGKLSLKADSTPVYASAEGSFLTNLMGPVHSFQVMPVSPSDSRTLAENSSPRTQTLDLISPHDPDLSDDSKCYLVTADSVSQSLMCSKIEKGFSMMYLNIVDEDGAIATVSSVTSWATTGGFAFATDFEATFRGGYLVTANLSTSEDFKNASMLFNYFEDSDRLLHGNAFTSWLFPDGGSKGDLFYSLQLTEDLGSSGALVTEGLLSYGDNKYFVKLAQDFELNQLKYNLAAEASGRYGGTWSKWCVVVLPLVLTSL
jgi:hypothetical protein